MGSESTDLNFSLANNWTISNQQGWMSSCFFWVEAGLSNKRWNRDVKIPEMTPPLKWWLRHKPFCVLPFCNYLQVSFKDEPTSTNVMFTSRLADMHSNMVTFKSRTYNSTNLKVCKHVLLLGKLFFGCCHSCNFMAWDGYGWGLVNGSGHLHWCHGMDGGTSLDRSTINDLRLGGPESMPTPPIPFDVSVFPDGLNSYRFIGDEFLYIQGKILDPNMFPSLSLRGTVLGLLCYLFFIHPLVISISCCLDVLFECGRTRGLRGTCLDCKSLFHTFSHYLWWCWCYHLEGQTWVRPLCDLRMPWLAVKYSLFRIKACEVVFHARNYRGHLSSIRSMLSEAGVNLTFRATFFLHTHTR